MPFDPEVMVERVIKMAGMPSGASLPGSEAVAGSEPDLEVMVTEIIHQIGVPAHIKGYHYVRESIMLAVKKHPRLSILSQSCYIQL